MLNKFRMLVACALTFALCWVPGFAFAGDAEDGAQVAATAHGLSYGIEGFERLAKGTARAMEGQPEGYRFPVDEDVDLVVAPAADRVVVWISPKAVEKYGLDPQDNECVSGLKALVCELDSANSMGGAQLGDVDLPWCVTAETTFDTGGYTYGFDERGADGDRYVVIASASGDAKGGARWLDSAHMVEASSVVLRDEQGPLDLSGFLFGRHRLSPVLGVHKNERPCPADLLCAGPVRRVEDHGYLESHQGPARFGLYDSYGAAAYGVRLFAAYSVWPFDRGGPVAHRARHLDRLYLARGGHFGRRCVVSAGLPHGTRSLREPRHADARRRANLGMVRTSHLCQAHDAARWPSIAAGTVLAFVARWASLACTLSLRATTPALPRLSPSPSTLSGWAATRRWPSFGSPS